MTKKVQLFKQNPHRYDIILLIIVSVVLFITGIITPVITFEKLIFKKETYSLFSGITTMFRQNQVLLGIVVSLFSICFPIVKYIALIIIWFGKFSKKRSRISLKMLKLLGRWSMLDFFVTVIAVGSMELGILAKATIRSGIYYFGAAILLSIVVSFLIGNTLPEPKEKMKVFIAYIRNHWELLVFAIVGLVILLTGISLPLITLEKWEFWKNGFSLLKGSLNFIQSGHQILGYVLLLFVILMPLLQFLSILLLYGFIFFKWKERKILNIFLFFNDWSMIDVFVLSLLVFLLKSGEDVKISLHAGFWLLIITAAISITISIYLAVISKRKG